MASLHGQAVADVHPPGDVRGGDRFGVRGAGRGLRPVRRRDRAELAEAGKLGAILAQFPSSFKPDQGTLDYLTDTGGWAG